MLEDMEELFALEMPSGIVQETCCGCFPDPKGGMLGFRTLPEEKRTSSTKGLKKSTIDPTKPSEGLLFEPSSLHKYSTGEILLNDILTNIPLI